MLIPSKSTWPKPKFEEFRPFGSSAYVASQSALTDGANRYRYQGKERDLETGFDYYRYRYLCSWLGRWTCPDPGGTVDGLNLMSFVGGDPVGKRDVDGRQDALGTIVGFEVDSAELSDTMRQQVAAMVEANPGATFSLVGMTSTTGDVSYNDALGQLRSEGVAQYLLELGVEPSALKQVTSVGERAALTAGVSDNVERAELRGVVVATSLPDPPFPGPVAVEPSPTTAADTEGGSPAHSHEDRRREYSRIGVFARGTTEHGAPFVDAGLLGVSSGEEMAASVVFFTHTGASESGPANVSGGLLDADFDVTITDGASISAPISILEFGGTAGRLETEVGSGILFDYHANFIAVGVDATVGRRTIGLGASAGIGAGFDNAPRDADNDGVPETGFELSLGILGGVSLSWWKEARR